LMTTRRRYRFCGLTTAPTFTADNKSPLDAIPGLLDRSDATTRTSDAPAVATHFRHSDVLGLNSFAAQVRLNAQTGVGQTALDSPVNSGPTQPTPELPGQGHRGGLPGARSLRPRSSTCFRMSTNTSGSRCNGVVCPGGRWIGCRNHHNCNVIDKPSTRY
jgi:hypothetical protein